MSRDMTDAETAWFTALNQCRTIIDQQRAAAEVASLRKNATMARADAINALCGAIFSAIDDLHIHNASAGTWGKEPPCRLGRRDPVPSPAPDAPGAALLVCDGCNVRYPFEHRCHGHKSVVRGEPSGRSCECQDLACRDHQS